MMRFQLDDLAARGDVAAILNASEAGIYGRYGYGLASSYQVIEVDTARAPFADPVDVPGRLDLVPKAEAHGLLAEAWRRCLPTSVGEVTRTDEWWQQVLGDVEAWKGGGPVFAVVHRDTAGRPDGYALYTVQPALLPTRWTLRCRELVALDDAVRRALWRYLLDVDLIGTVEMFPAPLDDPLRWWLADPRQARVTRVSDYLWVRPLDLAAYLSARTYGGDAEVVVEVADRFRPANDGCWSIAPGADGGPGTCARTDRAPDLAATVADLGSLSLGGVDATTLARAGRVRELRPGALATADRLFATERQPYCTTRF
jgi:predicted acetyltransferase